MGRATAHGKVILAGEHFVVYGTAAIALPVSSRGVTVDVERRPGVWEVPVGVEEHLLRCLKCLGEQAEELTLRVQSTLPIGAGLGGSAALAVALVRALDQDGVSDVEVRARAHRLEEIAHGSPSGIDDAVATFGCPVFMSPVGTVEPLVLVELPRVWIAVSDEPSLTLEAVTRVSEIKKNDERRFSALRARGAELVALAHAALLACDWTGLGAVMRRNHELLSDLGVSTPALDRLVAVAQQAGAYGAKLTGAGRGGAVLALAPDGVELGEPWLESGAKEVIAP